MKKRYRDSMCECSNINTSRGTAMSFVLFCKVHSFVTSVCIMSTCCICTDLRDKSRIPVSAALCKEASAVRMIESMIFLFVLYVLTSTTKHSRKQTHLWTVQTTAQCSVLTARLLWVRMTCVHICCCNEVLVASWCLIVWAGALLLFPFCR